jgi:hypothetical protein
MPFKTVKIFAGLLALSVSVSAAAQDRVFTSQGTAKSDAEAVAIAKRSAQDMVARINSQTIASYDNITGYGSAECEPREYLRVRTCYVDVYISSRPR